MTSIDLENYIEELFKTAVGDLGISPADFYTMSVREVKLAIDGKNTAMERDYNLMLIACINGNGMVHVGKKFKPINPFEKEKKVNRKHKPNKKERDETLTFLEQFEK